MPFTALVLALTDFGTYSDVEGTPLTAVRISALTTDGLQYDATGTGTWAAVTLNQVISAADIGTGRLRFVPDANENGSPYPTIGFEVSDGAAFSAATYTLTLNVTPVNDAPVSTNDTASTAEDTALVLALTDFGTYSDVEGTPFEAVRISALATDASLQYDTTGTGTWAAVTLNQVISAADIGAGRLRFVPDANENGSPYATIGFTDRKTYPAAARLRSSCRATRGCAGLGSGLSWDVLSPFGACAIRTMTNAARVCPAPR